MVNSTKTRTPQQPAIYCAGGTNPGRQRVNNEDVYYANEDGDGIFIVVDGMGGQAAGEKAAEIALDKLRYMLKQSVGSVEKRIRLAIVTANNAIYDEAEKNQRLWGMACVLTVAVVEENGQVTIGHVGDTRLYKLQLGAPEEEKIKKLTHDHSPVGEREEAGDLSEEDAMRHPRRNEVYRDVGSQHHETDDLDFIEIIQTQLEPNSALLLCSDGLSDLVTKNRIRQIVDKNRADPGAVVARLIEAANEAGGKDNITVVYAAGEKYAGKGPAAIPRTRDEYEEDEAPTRRQDSVDKTSAPARSSQPQARHSPQPSTTPGHDRKQPSGRGYSNEPPPEPVVHQPSGHTPTFLQHDRAPGADARAQAREISVNQYGNGGFNSGYIFFSSRSEDSSSRKRVWIFLVTLSLLLLILFVIGYLATPDKKDNVAPKTTPSPSGANTLLVGDGKNFKKIGDALKQAKSGDTILVGPGIYQEQLTLIDGVNLICDKEGSAIIELPRSSSDDRAVVVADSLNSGRFEGFRVAGAQDSTGAKTSRIGILVKGSKITIEKVEVLDAKEAAIYVEDGSDVEIVRCKIHYNPGTGVLAKDESKVNLTEVSLNGNGKNIEERGRAEVTQRPGSAAK